MEILIERVLRPCFMVLTIGGLAALPWAFFTAWELPDALKGRVNASPLDQCKEAAVLVTMIMAAAIFSGLAVAAADWLWPRMQHEEFIAMSWFHLGCVPVIVRVQLRYNRHFEETVALHMRKRRATRAVETEDPGFSSHSRPRADAPAFGG